MSNSAGGRYRALHDKFFVLPNPWDPGSAVMMEALGFVALATSSSGLAMSRSGQDGDIGRDELVEHVAQLTSVVDVPINVDDTISRLESYRDAGAEVLYAPGLTAPADITRVVELGLPVNVLAMPGAPSPIELAELGVIRMSTGGALARLAYTTMQDAARTLLDGVR
jgi:2-methylisocitrate lyase-like PEP mutase family enzyme